ncbi:MAG: NAD(P)/FAD-dependent oxidoreductase, partial [Longimicrobiales bacterium]
MRIVLLGAGHAHVEVCRRAGELVRRGFEPVLVSPGGLWYSGLATGVLGGIYPPGLDLIDAGVLIERAGGRYIRARAVRIQPRDQLVVLDDGATLPYDLLSCNLGSRSAADAFEGAGEAVPVKPIERLVGFRAWLDARIEHAPPSRVLVAGGGASGCEVASNLAVLLRNRGLASRVTIATRRGLLRTLPRRAAAVARRALLERGVDVREDAAVVAASGDVARLASGVEVGFDALIDATGARPPALLAEAD